jgi:hypothetical protein
MKPVTILFWLSLAGQLVSVDARALHKKSATKEIDTTKNMIRKAEEEATVVIDNTTNQLRLRKTGDGSSAKGEDGSLPKNNALLKSGNSLRVSENEDYDDEDYNYVAPIINIKFKRSAEDNRTNRLEKEDASDSSSSTEELLKDPSSSNSNNSSKSLYVRSNSSLTKSHRRKNRRRKQQNQQKKNIS